MKLSINDLVPVGSPKIIGQGQFSRISRAFHPTLKRYFAVKKVDKADLEEDEVRHLGEEFAIHKSLNHPNIIRLFETMDHGEDILAVYELAPNGCLFFYIDNKTGVPQAVALRVLYQMSHAVGYLHSLSIIHRDIKPENVVFDKDFNAKLLDFGCSRRLGPRETRRSVCGTYEYMSPEIVREQGHDYKTDIWCLGVLFYEMLHGHPPFADVVSLSDLEASFKGSKIKLKPDLHPDIADLLLKMLELNQFNRPNIDQVLHHRVFEQVKGTLDKPFSFSEINQLRRNYTVAAKNMTQLENPVDVLKDVEKYRSSVDSGGLAQELQRRSISPSLPHTTPQVVSQGSPSLNTATVTWANSPGQVVVPQATIQRPMTPILASSTSVHKQQASPAVGLTQSLLSNAAGTFAQPVNLVQSQMVSSYETSRTAYPPPVELSPAKDQSIHADSPNASRVFSNSNPTWNKKPEVKIYQGPGMNNRPSVTWISHGDAEAPKATQMVISGGQVHLNSGHRVVMAEPPQQQYNSPPMILTTSHTHFASNPSNPVYQQGNSSQVRDQQLPKANSLRLKDLLKEASESNLDAFNRHLNGSTEYTSPGYNRPKSPIIYEQSLNTSQTSVHAYQSAKPVIQIQQSPTTVIPVLTQKTSYVTRSNGVGSSPVLYRKTDSPNERVPPPTFNLDRGQANSLRYGYDQPQATITRTYSDYHHPYENGHISPSAHQSARVFSSIPQPTIVQSIPKLQPPTVYQVNAKPPVISAFAAGPQVQRGMSPTPGGSSIEVRVKSRDRVSQMGINYDEFSLRKLH